MKLNVGGIRMRQKKMLGLYSLSIIIAICAVFTSIGGIFFEGVYRDNQLIVSVMRANDIVTLFIAAPIMFASIFWDIKNSYRARLIWIGTLFYMMYNFMFYLYGVAFNSFFLFYVFLFTASAYAIIFAFIKTDIKLIAKNFSEKTPVRMISGFMLFFCLLLGGLWIGMSMSYLFTGEIPQTVIDSGHPTAVVFATDLSILIPAIALGAILLWKKREWGYILSTVMMVKATTYGTGFIIMGIITYMDIGVKDSMLPLWAFLTLGCILSLISLIKNLGNEY